MVTGAAVGAASAMGEDGVAAAFRMAARISAAITITVVLLAAGTQAFATVGATGEAAMLLVASATVRATKLGRDKQLMVKPLELPRLPSHRQSAMQKHRLR